MNRTPADCIPANLSSAKSQSTLPSQPLDIIVLGLGRFGRLWADCVSHLGRVRTYDPAVSPPPASDHTHTQLPDLKALHQALGICDILFFCVPISAMQQTLIELGPGLISRRQAVTVKPLWLMDTCSVKVQPMQHIQHTIDQLGDTGEQSSFRLLGLHPMFGPDSFNSNSVPQSPPLHALHAFHPLDARWEDDEVGQSKVPDTAIRDSNSNTDLRLVLCPQITDSKDNSRPGSGPSGSELLFWEQSFLQLGFRSIVMSADAHDREAARTQGLTHLLGRVLEAFDIDESPMATTGYRTLCELREQTCHDTWQLFLDLQQQNNYTPAMRCELQKAFETVCTALAELGAHQGPKQGH
ncbi:prephenate dehydrogenase/arogenate dehydrogenase family protein [Candidatus Haliotispira prima]|uniref:Prephenate dehydrogenase/arogenate dehydrogenase family protein n=1 Tax=Candidatus Haliotispira prima TaxID=3034016 RepID=A0ABY8MHP1_9SPIO|nr:prephenate dehydrogenase/arogenate dehydrogenase family protein [Candidatus Haliotispira prima]